MPANPQTAASLLQLAAAIARDRHYELECLQVILATPRHSSHLKHRCSRRLLGQAEVLARKWKIPVHTQIRVTMMWHAMLETINERHIDLDLDGLER